MYKRTKKLKNFASNFADR